MSLSKLTPGPAAKASPARKRFDQLLEQISKQRELLLQIESDSEALLARWGERMQREKAAMQKSLWDYILALDQLTLLAEQGAAQGKKARSFKMTTAQHKTLSSIIIQLLTSVDDSAYQQQRDVLYQRHAGQSISEIEAEELQEFKDAVIQQFGEQMLEGFEGHSIEELAAFTQARMRARDAQADEPLGTNAEDLAQPDLFEPNPEQAKHYKKPKRQRDAEAAQLDLEQSVRELFRKLISDLHPDRERDEALRERKSEWMKRANQAYKNNDVLALWRIRAEFSNVSELPIDTLSEARLKNFCASLVQQLDRVKLAQRKATDELHQRLGLAQDPYARPKSALNLERALQQRSSETNRRIKQLKDEIQLLKNPELSGLIVKQICAEHRQMQRMAELDDEFIDAFESSFESTEFGSSRRKRRRY